MWPYKRSRPSAATMLTSLCGYSPRHFSDVIMSPMASQITGVSIIYSTVQRKHQSSASLAFVRGIHQWPVESPHKGPVTRKIIPFDDVIINSQFVTASTQCVLTVIGKYIWRIRVNILGESYRNDHMNIHKDWKTKQNQRKTKHKEAVCICTDMDRLIYP